VPLSGRSKTKSIAANENIVKVGIDVAGMKQGTTKNAPSQMNQRNVRIALSLPSDASARFRGVNKLHHVEKFPFERKVDLRVAWTCECMFAYY
jgi:hypothetical protein